MRHKGMSVLVASQDPPSVPIKLIELSDVVVLHKFKLASMAAAHAEGHGLARRPDPSEDGEAWRPARRMSGRASQPRRTSHEVLCGCGYGPRITRHGGGTKTALD